MSQQRQFCQPAAASSTSAAGKKGGVPAKSSQSVGIKRSAEENFPSGNPDRKRGAVVDSGNNNNNKAALEYGEDDNDDDSSVNDEEPPEGEENEGNGEILHCMFPGCTKEFSSRWSLTRHTRTHTGERPFRCGTCGKEFVQKCSLKRHEQTHSQEKQWICDHENCGKRFKLKEYLDVHKRTHLKIEPEPLPQEDEEQVVQDAADAAGALIDQLRQRLVRMSVRHHEQLFAHQQREMQLMQSLQECSGVLDQAVSLLNERNPGMVPPFMIEALMRFSSAASGGAIDTASSQGVGVAGGPGGGGGGSGGGGGGGGPGVVVAVAAASSAVAVAQAAEAVRSSLLSARSRVSSSSLSSAASSSRGGAAAAAATAGGNAISIVAVDESSSAL